MKTINNYPSFKTTMPLSDPSKYSIEEGFPVNQLNKVFQKIDFYKKLIAITVLANTIIATIGVMYL